jgi:hypothetical protein
MAAPVLQIQKNAVLITGAWIRVVKGMSQIMLEVDGKWREVLPTTNVGDADVSVEISAEEIAKSQPLGWLYK